MIPAPEKKSFEGYVQKAWDATSLDLAMACPRKYFYTMILGITPKSQSVHLIFGGIFASALELFYKLRAEGASIDEATVETVRFAMIESWDSEAGRPVEFDDAKKTRPNLIRSIVWYIDKWGDESEGFKTYHLSDGRPAVELSFSLDIGDDILYCGHLDRVVDADGALYVLDQKTTGGTISTYYFNNFSPSNQMSGYAFAGQAILHTPIAGVIIDAAQISHEFTRFERAITSRSKAQLEEWAHGVRSFVRRFQALSADAAGNPTAWPMHPSACGMYGGCAFRPLCQKDPRIREFYIKSDYVPHLWDPIKER